MKLLLPALCALLAAACGGSRSPGFVFPPSMGDWTLSQVKDIAPAAAPEQIGRLGLKRGHAAVYESAGQITAEIYELTSDAGALEVEQTWKPSADTVAFHRKSYFAVVRWTGADRGAVTAFVRELEKELGK